MAPYIIGGVVVVLLAGGYWFWRMTQQPLYQPGMVRDGRNLRHPLEPPAQPGDAWRVEPNVELYHFSVGNGEPILVLHGGPGIPTREPWPGLGPLTDRFEFHYYDQRGCGKSTRFRDRFESRNFYANMKELDRGLGIGAQVADIERIRRILGQDKLTLIGHSFGGFLAAMYAAEFPERVKRLILVAPADVLVWPVAGDGFFEVIGKRLPAEMRGEYVEFLGEYLNFGKLFTRSEQDLSRLHGGFAKYVWAALGKEQTGRPDPDEVGGWSVWAQYVSMGRRRDYRKALSACDAPVMILHGTEDLLPPATSRRYADSFPNAELREIAGAGHFPFRETPEAFAEAADDFLRGG